MTIYDKASKNVPIDQRMAVYDVYIAKAMDFFGIGKVREIYQTAIEAQPPHELSDEDCKKMFVRFATLEKNLGEIDRARAIYTQASYLADPDKDKYNHSFQSSVHAPFCEMAGSFGMRGMNLRFDMGMKIHFAKCGALSDPWLPVSAKCISTRQRSKQPCHLCQVISSISFALYTYIYHTGAEPMDTSAIAALEKKVDREQEPEVFGKFVKGEVIQTAPSQPQPSTSSDVTANPEILSLEEDDEEEEEAEIDVAEKDVPEAVFGGLKRKPTSSASVSKKKRQE